MVGKLHEKLYLQNVTLKMNTINDSFKNNMMQIKQDNASKSVNKLIDTFTPDNLREDNQSILLPIPIFIFILLDMMNNIFFPFQNQNPNIAKATPSLQQLKEFQSHNPVNVNYFIFQEPIGDKAVNGLKNIFNFNNSNTVSQNHLITAQKADKGEQVDINENHFSSNKFQSGKKPFVEINYKKEEFEERNAGGLLAQVSPTKKEANPPIICSPKNQAFVSLKTCDEPKDQKEKKEVYPLKQMDINSK